jgi:hypothetical protein
MSIASLDNYIASVKQVIPFSKLAARTTVASVWFSVFDLAGNPGAGTLAGTSTAAGVVPTDATAGCPIIGFSSGSGYLANVDFSNTVASRLIIADMLWKGGAYAFNSGTTSLSAQPSYSSRVPSGTDYTGLQIWIEVSTAFTTGTTWHVEVTYTNQAGTPGHTTTTMASHAAAALTIGKMEQLALQSGDTGVQKIESVIVTTGGMVAGAFNVLVLRPLWTGRVTVANGGDCHGIDRTGLPQVWTDSALVVLCNADSASSGFPDLTFQIASN